MKPSLLTSTVFIILLIFLVSCKKQTEENIVTPQLDDILYIDISPDISCTSIRDWTSLFNWSIPIPDDSSAGLLLDLNQNGIDDMGVGVHHFYSFVSASNPGANYNYSCGIGIVSKTDGIAYKGTSGPCKVAEPFTKDSLISGKSTYYTSARAYSSGHALVCGCDVFSGDTYFGVKLTNNGIVNFGWVLMSFNSNVLIIKEFAINRTNNNPIRAGQKQ